MWPRVYAIAPPLEETYPGGIPSPVDTILASESFWPIAVLAVLHAISFVVMATVLKMFAHAKRKQADLLSTFPLASGGSAIVLHKRGRRWIVSYVALTVAYAVGTIAFLVFQPHIL